MNRKISVLISIIFLLALSVTCSAINAEAARIKEIANFQGVRTNYLIGYGLVVGLDGKGDKSGTEFTTQSLVNMLNRFGVRVDPSAVTVKNVASVMVTANLSPLNRSGSKLDVIVSSIGDAKTLQGGTLLFTPLNGADGEVYAVAQGSVSIGGFMGGGSGGTVEKNFQTVGRVIGGALVEREIPLDLADQFYILLKKPDFTTANSITEGINRAFGDTVATAIDSTRIRLVMPEKIAVGAHVEFLSIIEGIEVAVDTISKVVVNERTGTVVIGKNVNISTVAVAHGNLTVEIEKRAMVSQPAPFSLGQTVQVVDETVTVVEEEARLIIVPEAVGEGVKLGDLVAALNALGVTPRDLIAILQAIKSAGALQAELELI